MKSWHYEKYFSAEYWGQVFKGRHTLAARLGKFVRICVASIRGFTDDDCSDKASALTFYTLLSIIPVLAVAFGIAKGFGFEQHLEAEIILRFSDQREIADKLIVFAHSMLKNTQSGLIAGVGLAVLFWSVLKLMGNIESSFNAIWKIKRPRSWGRRISDYFAMMLFCPLFFAVSSSFTVFVTTELMHFTETNDMGRAFSPFVVLVLHLFPLALSWLLFTALYYIMPNGRVPFSYALMAGITAGTLYQIVQWIYIQFQVGLASYGAIYGSFAALPLFLLWLNTSWLIALAGAELAYHAENYMALNAGYPLTLQRHFDERVLGLLVMHDCIKAFQDGLSPPSIYDLARSTGVAVTATRQLVHQFIEAGLLVEITLRNGISGYYQPGRDIKAITIKDVCDALDSARQEHYAIILTEEAEQYAENLAAIDALLKAAPINYTLDLMLRRTIKG